MIVKIGTFRAEPLIGDIRKRAPLETVAVRADPRPDKRFESGEGMKLAIDFGIEEHGSRARYPVDDLLQAFRIIAGD